MIKNDIALAIEKKTEFNRAKSLSIVEGVLESLKSALAGREKVEIRGFGSFKVVAKKVVAMNAPKPRNQSVDRSARSRARTTYSEVTGWMGASTRMRTTAARARTGVSRRERRTARARTATSL